MRREGEEVKEKGRGRVWMERKSLCNVRHAPCFSSSWLPGGVGVPLISSSLFLMYCPSTYNIQIVTHFAQF